MSEAVAPLDLTTILPTSLANLTSEECFGSSELGVNVGGLVAIIVFYVAVLLVSIVAKTPCNFVSIFQCHLYLP